MQNLLQKLSFRQRLLLFSLLVASLSFVYYHTVYLPQRENVLQAAARVNTQKQQIRTAENFVLQHPDPDIFLGELSKKQADVDKLIPDTPGIGDFLLMVDRCAKNSGLRVAQIKPAAPVNKNGYREIPVEITAAGSFFQTINFIKLLEGGERFCTIGAIGLKAQGGQIQSRMSAVIFVYGIQPAPTK